MEDPDILYVPAEIFSETVTLLLGRAGPKAARAAGEYLWSQPHIEVQMTETGLLMAAWGEFEDGRPGLSFPDCVVVAACRELEAEPVTFDKAILRALQR